jgi:uncharacterized lipoprotein YmbA
MKMILTTIAICTLVGCSSSKPPTSNLIVMDEMRPLTRDEVILGIDECESNNHRAVVTRAPVKVAGTYVNVAVDVSCSPRYKLRTHKKTPSKGGGETPCDRRGGKL